MHKKNSSNVWKYFTKIHNKPDQAECNICHIAYKHGHGTSNLFEHLRRKHQSKLDADKYQLELEKDLDAVVTSRIQQEEASTSKRSFEETTTTTNKRNCNEISINEIQVPETKKSTKQLLLSQRFGTPSEKQRADFSRSIVEMITEDMQPLSIVENSGFRKVVQLLDSRYLELLPSRRTLTRNILPDLYSSTKIKLQGVLNKSNYISITSDIWTSLNTDSFMTITVHLFDDTFSLKTFVLCTIKLESNHTGEYLSQTMANIFNEWEIMHKIVAIVTDSGANIKSAVKKLQIPHIPCTAHILNLIVTKSLTFKIPNDSDNDVESLSDNEVSQNLSDILKKCRSIVTYFKKSEVANRKLAEKLLQLGVPKLKLVQDVSTRWNSVLLMLERLIKLKEPLTYAMVSSKDGPNMLDAQEWDVIEDIIPILKPFELMTAELSDEDYPTLAMVIPLVRGLQLAVMSTQSTTYLGKVLKDKLLESIEKRFNLVEEQNEYSKATIMDPRFKKLAFQHKINAENVEIRIRNELALLTNENFNENYSSTREYHNNISGNETDATVNSNDTIDLWGYLNEKIDKERTEVTSLSIADSILAQYFSLPHCHRKSKPIDFWEKHRTLQGPLFHIALKYLVIPATSVPSERIFSKAGEIMSAKRNRTNPKNLDMIIFLNKNLKEL